MVKKIDDIEGTVAAVVKHMSSLPAPPKDADEHELLQHKALVSTAHLQGEFARYYLEELNKGMDAFYVFLALLNVTAVGLANVVNNVDDETADAWVEALHIKAHDPENSGHQRIHTITDALSVMLHKNSIKQYMEAISGYQRKHGTMIPIHTKDVGDA